MVKAEREGGQDSLIWSVTNAIAGSDANVTVSQAESAYVQTMGDADAFLNNIAGDAFLWSGGDSAGSVEAGQDVLAISLERKKGISRMALSEANPL